MATRTKKTFVFSGGKGASSMRTGTFTTSALQPQTDEAIVVTFSSPMPSTDYIVDFEAYTSMYAISIVESTKTVNGFTAKVRNVANSAGSAREVTYTAFKLYSDVEYSNIVNSIPSNASASNKLVAKSDVVNKFDTDITPTSGVTGLYNTVIDCATQLVTALEAKGQGSWSGLVTYTGSWSGQYVSLVYNALCVISGTFRYNNDIHNFYAIHNGNDLKVSVENMPTSVTRMSPIAGGFAVFNLPANTVGARIVLLDKYGAPAHVGSCPLTISASFTSETDSMWYASITDINTAFSGAAIANGDAISVKIEITY